MSKEDAVVEEAAKEDAVAEEVASQPTALVAGSGSANDGEIVAEATAESALDVHAHCEATAESAPDVHAHCEATAETAPDVHAHCEAIAESAPEQQSSLAVAPDAGDITAENSSAVKPSQSSVGSREPQGPKPSQNGKKANGGKHRRQMPSILAELGLKATSKGIILPESRRNYLKRRREARELGILPAWTPNLSLDDGKPNKKQKKKNQLALTGRMLDELEQDLFSSAFSGDIGLCQETIAAGVDVNVRTKADIDGLGTCATALHVAASKGSLEVVAALVRANADVLAESGRGEAPVKVATRAGHVDVVRILGACGGTPVDTESAMQLLDKAPQWGNKHKKMHSVLLPQTWGTSSSSNHGARRERSDDWRGAGIDSSNHENQGMSEPSGHARESAGRRDTVRESGRRSWSSAHGRGKGGGKRNKDKLRGEHESEG